MAPDLSKDQNEMTLMPARQMGFSNHDIAICTNRQRDWLWQEACFEDPWSLKCLKQLNVFTARNQRLHCSTHANQNFRASKVCEYQNRVSSAADCVCSTNKKYSKNIRKKMQVEPSAVSPSLHVTVPYCC